MSKITREKTGTLFRDIVTTIDNLNSLLIQPRALKRARVIWNKGLQALINQPVTQSLASYELLNWDLLFAERFSVHRPIADYRLNVICVLKYVYKCLL